MASQSRRKADAYDDDDRKSLGQGSKARSRGSRNSKGSRASRQSGPDFDHLNVAFDDYLDELQESGFRSWPRILCLMMGLGLTFLWKKRRHELLTTVSSLMSMYQVFIIPYQTAYDIDVSFDFLYFISYVVDFVQFACAVVVLRPRKLRFIPVAIALSVFPYDLILWITVGSLNFYVRVIRLIPALQLLNASMLDLEKGQLMSFKASRSIHLVLLLLITTHWIGCTFYLFARLDDAQHYNHAPWATQSNLTDLSGGIHYLRTIYWALATLSTVGHVDMVNPQGEPGGGAPWEFVMAICINLAAMMTFLFLSANVTSMMLKFFSEMEGYRSRVGTLDKFLRSQRVNRRLRSAIHKHIATTSGGNDEGGILQQLPVSLKREVLKDMHMRVLIRCPEVLELDRNFLGQMCTSIKPQEFEPGEEICAQGDVMHEFYFLVSGKVQSTIEPPDDGVDSDDLDDEQYEAREKDRALQRAIRVIREVGTAIGLYAFLFGTKQDATIRAIVQTSCLMLSREGYKIIAQEFPRDVFKMRKKTLAIATDLHGEEATANVTISAGMEDVSEKQASQLETMFEAAKEGNDQTLRVLLNPMSTDTAINIDDVDKDNHTALHVAAARGKKEAVGVLLELGASHSLRDVDGRTPLSLTIQRGFHGIARQLRNAGASLGWDEATSASALCEAAKANNMDHLDLLLFCGASINSVDYDKRSCTHIAACVGNKSAVQALIRKGASLNMRDRYGGTPLWDAVREEHAECAKLLYEARGELMMTESATAHHLGEATRAEKPKLVELMLQCGANVDSRSSVGRTCVHVAASLHRSSVVDILIENSANLNLQDTEGTTPLALALRNGQIALARKMIDAGAQALYDEMTAAAELCQYAQKGDVERLQLLLDAGCPAASTDYDNLTALHLACAGGHMMAVQLLVESQVDVNCADRWGNTPMYEAVRHSHIEIAEYCIEHGGQLHLDSEQAAGEICEPATAGDVQKLKLLVRAGASADSADYDLRSGLHLAACHGEVEACKVLCELRADVSLKDRWGNTPLCDAVREGHAEAAELLRSFGAVLGYEHSRTAGEIILLAMKNDLERLQMLISCRADLDSVNHDMRSCLHIACSRGNMGIVESLLANKAYINPIDRDGHTPLVDAIKYGHYDVARYLIERGGSLGFDEYTAASYLFEAAKSGNKEKIQLLIAGDCNVNSKSFSLRTCLHLAASSGHSDIVTFLASASAELNAKDRWGGTPLADAVRECEDDVIVCLKEAGAQLCYDSTTTAGELCDLAFNGNIEKIKLFIECGADANTGDYDSRACIHLAACCGHEDIVQLLLSHSVNINYIDRVGGTALADAVREGHHELAQVLIKSGGALLYGKHRAACALLSFASNGHNEKVQLLLAGKWGGTPLADAIREGFTSLAFAMHARGAELKNDETSAASDMCESTYTGNIERLKVLLNCGLNVDAADYDKRRCIHLAACAGKMEMVDFLLARKTNFNAQDRYGGTPLVDALREGHHDIAVKLLEKGARLLMPEGTALEQLSACAGSGDIEQVKLLLRCGVSANSADYDKRTCLHLAASMGAVPIIRALLQASAEVNLRDRWGGTALADAIRESHEEAALREGHKELAVELHELGGELKYEEEQMTVREGSHAIACRLVELNAHVNFDKTTTANELCKYASHGDVEGIRILLAGGADVNAADHRGRTCLHLAASAGRLSVMEELLRVENLNINPVDAGGGTPLLDALRENQPKLAAMLFERNGSLSLPDDVASLRLATLARHAGYGYLHLVEFLVKEAKADPHIKDPRGATALDYALHAGHQHIVAFLSA
ncbi:hypothetical protein AB1Y20_018379 [Prymnesium parvum]|uniref:Cyclic nucleotide-binding domain-containing protein n=1 Tax=Prymnesium parvum TaxID=97485 RepID=A0AB34JN87_PRYPA